ncbi:hypothetical protein [Cupriavidus taiwanensis]
MATLIATGSMAEATAAGGILASSAFAAGGIANLAIAGALGSIASSAAIQLGTTGRIKFDRVATAGLAGAVTGGLAGYFGGNYGVDRLLASGFAGCGTAAMQGGDCKSGAMTGSATAAVAWTANVMRQDQIESSRRFKGIYDGKEGMTAFQRMMFEIQTDIDIPLAAPFAGVTLLNQYGIDWSVFRNQTQQSKDRK